MVQANLYKEILRGIIRNYKMEMRRKKILSRKYLIVDGTRAVSSGDLSCDTIRGRLKSRDANKICVKKGNK